MKFVSRLDPGRLRVARLARQTTCALLSATLVIGCAENNPPPQTAADTSANATANVSPDASLTSPKEAKAPSENGDSNKTTRYVGWIAVGVGAQAAIFAVATSFLMLHENAERSSECNAQKICTADGLDANAKLGQTGAFNAVSWIVAAAGIGVGAYLVLANPPSDDGSKPSSSSTKSSPSAAIGVGSNGAGMGLNFRSQF
jgi:hypothetical protein